MGNEALVTRLRDRLGKDAVLTDTDVTASYARDMMPLAPSGKPLAVVLPLDVEGVQEVVRACAEAKVPIVPRGAGSGLSGAANAIDGCVMLSLTKLDQVLEIDAGNRLAVVLTLVFDVLTTAFLGSFLLISAPHLVRTAR